MSNKNKPLTVAITVLMVLSFSSVFNMCDFDIDGDPFNSEEEIIIDDLIYIVTKEAVSPNPGEVSLVGPSSETARTGELVIPTQIEHEKKRYNVTSIGEGAFYGCYNLTGSLTIPDSVTHIGNGAFNNCSNLTGSLTIADSVTYIGEYAFSRCSELKGPLTLSNGVTSIESHTFYDCRNLTGPLIIPNGVTSIGESAFDQCEHLTGPLTIPNGVTSIGESAFYQCQNITGPLTIPDGVTSIGKNAFSLCSKLTGPLIIPDSVTSIGEGAFYDCQNLTGPLTIPNSVTYIGESAFYDCRNLTGPLTIPNSVTYIGKNAFHDCSNFDALAIGSIDVTGFNLSEAFDGWSFINSRKEPISVRGGMVFEKSEGKMVDQGEKWMVTSCINNGSSDVDYTFIDRGEMIYEIDIPSPFQLGFIFKGWENYGEPVTIPHTVDDNEVLRAVWEKEKSIKMSFVDVDGELLDPMFCNTGDEFKMPSAMKDGYHFEGWKDSDGAFWAYQALYEVKGDMIFIAQWTEAPEPDVYCQLSFYDTDGTTKIFDPVSVKKGNAYELPTVTKDGYKFEGWKDGDGKVWKYTYTVNGETKLTAQWSEISHSDGDLLPISVACIVCALVGIVGTFFFMRYKG